MNDERLIQIVDAALVDVAARSGQNLACRPGCAQCCIGSFAINALDVQRLRAGFLTLTYADPERAQRLQRRIDSHIGLNRQHFPGEGSSGCLGETETERNAFEAFANEDVCPVLDPSTQTCDLYASRPMTCRVFGPPVRSETTTASGGVAHGLSVCELCFTEATEDEIAEAEMVPDPEGLEAMLLKQLSRQPARDGQLKDFPPERETTVPFAFAAWWSRES